MWLLKHQTLAQDLQLGILLYMSHSSIIINCKHEHINVCVVNTAVAVAAAWTCYPKNAR